jgi:hypothetical protein
MNKSERQKMTAKLASRFSWSKEPIEKDAIFGLFSLPLDKEGQPIEAQKHLLFMSKNLTAACKAGNRYSRQLKREQGYDLDTNYISKRFNDSKPVYKHSREASEGRPKEAFVVLPYPVSANSKDAIEYIASGLPFVDETLKSLEGWLQARGRLTIAQESDEIDSQVVFSEGAVRQIMVNAYERNLQARQQCIVHYGAQCFICEFDFGKVYGEIGIGFIHVHHLRQLSEIGEQYEVNPITDLRPVCPNCHAMLHRRSPSFDIEEMQAMLRERSA